MRRLGLIMLVAVLATLLVSIATFTAGAQTSNSTSASQGTFTGPEPSDAERRAAALDMAEEESLPDYSQVVDNAQHWRFDAPGWKRGGSDVWAHKGNYASAGASTSDARFKLKTPTAGDYALYAWWPVREGNSSAARFGVEAASGTKWIEMNQTRDGGTWVKIGTFEMKAGDRYLVRVSPEGGSGEAIADAVALVRGAASPPPNHLAPAEGGAGENVYGALATRSERQAIIRQGRKHLGTPYYHSPPSPCTAYRKEDCSCFTKLVFKPFGKRLPDHPVKQYWRHGKWVARADLKRGDLVFFKEAGWNRPITHVGMYSGNGYILHASNYYAYKKVVESKMKYLNGYFGAKRLQKFN
jgi:cell wall-associated NlpC family hydrolase